MTTAMPKHDLYRLRYPNGYELEWVDKPDDHPWFQAKIAEHEARKAQVQP